jgi:hypothetical protein
MKILLVYHTVLLIVAYMENMPNLLVMKKIVNVKNSIPWYKAIVMLIVLNIGTMKTCLLLITMLIIANVIVTLSSIVMVKNINVKSFVLKDMIEFL